MRNYAKEYTFLSSKVDNYSSVIRSGKAIICPFLSIYVAFRNNMYYITNSIPAMPLLASTLWRVFLFQGVRT